MMASGYSLHLYCDLRSEPSPHTWNEFPHEYGEETFGQAVKEARSDGWLFRRDGTHVCPKCSNKKKAERRIAARKAKEVIA